MPDRATGATGGNVTKEVVKRTVLLPESIDSIFSFPRASTVATVALGNGVTLLDLSGSGATASTLAEDYLDNVADGEFDFLPVFNPKLAGYLNLRLLVLLDARTGEASTHRVCTIFEETISGGYRWGPNTLLVGIETLSATAMDAEYSLRAFAVAPGKAERTAEVAIGPGFVSPHGKLVFHGRSGSVVAFDAQLKETSHPLIDGLAAWWAPDPMPPITDLVAHPTHRFALVQFAGGAYLGASWSRGPVTRFEVPLTTFQRVDFSPDGNWLAVWSVAGSQTRVDAVPVVRTDGGLRLGSPQRLESFSRRLGPEASAWTDAPLGLAILQPDKPALRHFLLPTPVDGPAQSQ